MVDSGGEHVLVAVEVGAEKNALFGDFTQGVEAEDLEAAGIGQDGAGPSHEFVEAAEIADGFGSGGEEKDDMCSPT